MFLVIIFSLHKMRRARRARRNRSVMTAALLNAQQPQPQAPVVGMATGSPYPPTVMPIAMPTAMPTAMPVAQAQATPAVPTAVPAPQTAQYM